MFIDFRERGRGERDKQRHQSVFSCMHPDVGLNPQPRYVSWLGIESQPCNLLVYKAILQLTKPPNQG